MEPTLAVTDREQIYFLDVGTLSPRLWLHAQGLSPLDGQQGAPLWRDASLHSHLCPLGGRKNHRIAGCSPSAASRQIQIRSVANSAGDTRCSCHLFFRSGDGPSDAVLRPGGIVYAWNCLSCGNLRLVAAIFRGRVVHPNASPAPYCIADNNFALVLLIGRDRRNPDANLFRKPR